MMAYVSELMIHLPIPSWGSGYKKEKPDIRMGVYWGEYCQKKRTVADYNCSEDGDCLCVQKHPIRMDAYRGDREYCHQP